MSTLKQLVLFSSALATLFLPYYFLHEPSRKPSSKELAAHPSPTVTSILDGIPIISDPSCNRAYTSLFARPDIEIRIIFGYKDARPARFVGDRYERLIFVQRLLKPCTPDLALDGSALANHSCGFTRSADDMDLFTKQAAGPDGKLRTIVVRVVHSSVGPDDASNRRDPFQKWQSKYARQAFAEGIKSADVVFYNGHSRSGGGPEFKPPKLGPGGGVDFLWYRSKKPGLKGMLKSLKESAESGGGSGAKLMGLFSCASTSLFSKQILDAKPGLGLITNTQLLYFADALDHSMAALSAVIGTKCRNEFMEALEGPPSAHSGAHFEGFFD